MRLDDIEPITSLKRDTAGVFERSRERNAPNRDHTEWQGDRNCLPHAVYERQQQALTMLKLIAQSDSAIEGKRTRTHAQAINELKKRGNRPQPKK